jgi:coenzyme F420-0:L-glutamate ligase / coenzyme F420-1:gamma-L-glutamate ligase
LAKVIGKDPRRITTVLSESSELLRYRQNVMIVAHRLGFVMANAGVDESNIGNGDGSGRVLLLPIDPDKSCADIKQRLDTQFSVSIGVCTTSIGKRPEGASPSMSRNVEQGKTETSAP